MKTITTHDAKTHMSRYLAEVEESGRITVARGKKPVAILVPVKSIKKHVRPKVGSIKGPRYEFPDAALKALNEEELKVGDCEPFVGYLHVSLVGAVAGHDQ